MAGREQKETKGEQREIKRERLGVVAEEGRRWFAAVAKRQVTTARG